MAIIRKGPGRPVVWGMPKGQSHVQPLSPSGGGGGGDYVGPLDLVAGAIGAYGQRALSVEKLGSAIYTIRRDSDDTEQTFISDAVTGDAPIDDIGTFLSGANGFGSLWNDQSGYSNHGLQAISANQPPWIASAANSRPGFSFTGASNLSTPKTWFATEGNVTFPGGAMTIFTVVLTNDVTVFNFIAGSNAKDFSYPDGPDWDFSFASGGGGGFIPSMFADSVNFDTYYAYSGPVPPGVGTAGVYYLIEGAFSSLAGSIVVDGIEQSLEGSNNVPGVVGDISLRMGIGTGDVGSAESGGGSALSNGRMCELIIYPTKLSDLERLTIRQNIAAYYGITLP